MIHWIENFALDQKNTFGFSSNAARYVEISDEIQLKDLPLQNPSRPFLVLGGGSNMILPAVLDKSVISFTKSEIQIEETSPSEVNIKVFAGCKWHELVKWSVEKALWGIENLALIPGLVGAAPVQNIGAYGVELKDVLTKVHYFDLERREYCMIDQEECQFGYRDSIFKNKLKNKGLIYAIELRLSYKSNPKLEYGRLKEETTFFEKEEALKPIDVFKAVCKIRNDKLPSPEEIGNCGSFFKNPIITTDKLQRLKKQYPDIPYYTYSEELVKIPTAWLLEEAGLKGISIKGIGTYHKQPLVIVNQGGSYLDLVEFVSYIQTTIFSKFAISIEKEVNIF